MQATGRDRLSLSRVPRGGRGARQASADAGNRASEVPVRTSAPLLWAVAMAAAVAEIVALALWVRWRFLRIAVEGDSMLPALAAGDLVLVDRGALRHYRPRAGHVVLARDPRHHSREIVKRVDHIDLHGAAWLAGDNPDQSTDSRQFGAVPRELVTGRVRWRYWPLHRVFGVR